jgi:hypothetical protein
MLFFNFSYQMMGAGLFLFVSSFYVILFLRNLLLSGFLSNLLFYIIEISWCILFLGRSRNFFEVFGVCLTYFFLFLTIFSLKTFKLNYYFFFSCLFNNFHRMLISYFLFEGYHIFDNSVIMFMKDPFSVPVTLPICLKTPPTRPLFSNDNDFIPVYHGRFNQTDIERCQLLKMPSWYVEIMLNHHFNKKKIEVSQEFEFLEKNLNKKIALITTLSNARNVVDQLDCIKYTAPKSAFNYFNDKFFDESLKNYELAQAKREEMGCIKVPIEVQLANWEFLHSLAETQLNLELLSVHAHVVSTKLPGDVFEIRQNPNTNVDVTVFNTRTGLIKYYDVSNYDPNKSGFEREMEGKLKKNPITTLLLTHPGPYINSKYSAHARIEILDSGSYKNLAEVCEIKASESLIIGPSKEIEFKHKPGSFVMHKNEFREIYEKAINKK